MDKTADIYEAGDRMWVPTRLRLIPERDPAAFWGQEGHTARQVQEQEEVGWHVKATWQAIAMIAAISRSFQRRSRRAPRRRRASEPSQTWRQDPRARGRSGSRGRGCGERGPRGSCLGACGAVSRPRGNRPSVVPSSSEARHTAVVVRRGPWRSSSCLARREGRVFACGGKAVSGDAVVPVAMASAVEPYELGGGEGRGSRDERYPWRALRKQAAAASVARVLAAMAAAAALVAPNESRDRRDPLASRDRRDDWRKPRTIPGRSVVAAIVAGVAATRPVSAASRAGGRDNRGSYGNSRGGKRGGSSRRPWRRRRQAQVTYASRSKVEATRGLPGMFLLGALLVQGGTGSYTPTS